jgi:acid stress-induced BolA-like protein IbaG/YrbA
MEPDQVKAALIAGLENCDITVQGEGSHYDILVVGELFAGLRPVKRQQLVYAVLADFIADGSMHAVNIRTHTAAEWADQGSNTGA